MLINSVLQHSEEGVLSNRSTWLTTAVGGICLVAFIRAAAMGDLGEAVQKTFVKVASPIAYVTSPPLVALGFLKPKDKKNQGSDLAP